MKTFRGARLRGLRWLEGLLWVLALVCVTSVAASWHAGHGSALAAERFSSEARESPASQPLSAAKADDAVIGRLEIPALGLDVPVLADYDAASLKRGVGHIPNTAMPGGLGNLGLAGHRDTYFRALRKVREGMLIEVRTAQGKFDYRIDSTEVVNPDQVRVLDIGERPEMTLITCYPFEFIGAAPQRFIVHARLLSLDPK